MTRLVFSVQRLVIQTMNVLAVRYALVVNVERNVILELVQLVNYVNTELALPVVVRIWIVPAIDRVSMDNVWTLVCVITLVARMLCVKYPNIEQFASVPTDSKVNRSKDAYLMNAKRMMTVNTISNVITVHARILAFSPVLVASMLSVAS